MSLIDEIIEKNNITTIDGFGAAMKAVAKASEGELRFFLSYSPDGQSQAFKRKQALARAELDRRQFKAQSGLVWVSAIVGVCGVLCGAALQSILTCFLK